MTSKTLSFVALFVLLIISLRAYRLHTTSEHKQFPQLQHSIQHFGIIMDGNRRWAKKEGFKPWVGHEHGVDPVKTAVEFCIEQKIPHLSLYAFSLENLNRSAEELDHLFSIIEKGLTNEEFEKLVKHNVKVKFIGNRSLFPSRLIPIIHDLESRTKDGATLTLNILFCYGGQQELTEAFQRIGKMIEEKTLTTNDITPDLIQKHLWTHESPNPDVILRTGGNQRLSNFMPWQSTYSELIFTEKYWPDITKEDLYTTIQKFEKTKRNFGR
jgi:undecaprenyl diphosphate synthase